MNNEAILNKLIELNGDIERNREMYIDADESVGWKKDFDPILWSPDFELVLRALFDECAKKGLYINIIRNHIIIEDLWGVEAHRGDTSRASFIQAFCKVTGVEL